MKKFTFTLLLLGITMWSFAQITLVNSDFAPVGTTIIQANDTLPDATIVPGNAGANQTWNFSALTEDFYDTTYMELPSATPYPDRFPNANFAMRNISSGDTMYAFFIRNDDLFSNIGLAGNFSLAGSIAMDVVPQEIIVDFPMQYGNHREESFYFQQTIGSPTPGPDSIRFKNSTEKTVDVDAWGNVTLPSGTYNSLRTKTTRLERDSTWALLFGTWTFLAADSTTTVSYDWYTNEVVPGFILVSMDYSNDSAYNVTFLKGNPVGIKQTKVLPLNVYPNPVKETATIRLSGTVQEQMTLKLYNQAGALVFEKTLDEKTIHLNMASFTAGTYFIVINSSSDSNVRYSGKIIKE